MSHYTPEAFVAELRTVLENVQTELSATGRHSARIQRCIEAMPSLAATLRQQAARVDDAMVVRALNAPCRAGRPVRDYIAKEKFWSPNTWDQGMHDVVRAALEAALSAQPALCEDEGCPHRGTDHVCVQPAPEWKGEAVAFVDKNVRLQYLASYTEQYGHPPIGTKLYTHPAAPVGVPEEKPDVEVLGTYAGDTTTLELWAHHQGWNDCREAMLAAAPSAPQGTQQGVG